MFRKLESTYQMQSNQLHCEKHTEQYIRRTKHPIIYASKWKIAEKCQPKKKACCAGDGGRTMEVRFYSLN